MTFSSPALDRLRAARAQSTPSAAPEPEPQVAQQVARVVEVTPAPLPAPRPPRPVPPPSSPPEPRPSTPPRPQARPARPSMSDRAQMRGHCGTCSAFRLAPEEGRFMGECSHGPGAFEPWARHSRLPVFVHESAQCMTAHFPRWALRPGVAARPDTDAPREVSA